MGEDLRQQLEATRQSHAQVQTETGANIRAQMERVTHAHCKELHERESLLAGVTQENLALRDQADRIHFQAKHYQNALTRAGILLLITIYGHITLDSTP